MTHKMHFKYNEINKSAGVRCGTPIASQYICEHYICANLSKQYTGRIADGVLTTHWTLVNGTAAVTLHFAYHIRYPYMVELTEDCPVSYHRIVVHSPLLNEVNLLNCALCTQFIPIS